MHRPDKFAFIVGAPRCGTTTLSRIFRQHPKICFSRVKEPHFFSRMELQHVEQDALREIVERDYVDRFFSQCSDEQSLGMEGSPTYLYTPERIAPVLKLWPDAKFIIAVRDPLTMVPSLHSRLLMTGDETIRDFPTAWALSSERREGRSVPPRCADPRWLLYDQAAAFGSYVTRFFDLLGRERCEVVLLDDLENDPPGTYRQLCEFLGVEPWPDTRFGAARSNKAYRIGWLQRLLKRPPRAAPSLLAGQKFLAREGQTVTGDESRLVAAALALRKRLLKWNEVPAERKPLDDSTRRMIVEQYKDEVELLSRVIDRDLSHWLRAG